MEKRLAFYCNNRVSNRTTILAAFRNKNRKALVGGEMRRAALIISRMTHIGEWTINAGDWIGERTNHVFREHQTVEYHPLYNEICAALEREFHELRGYARYRRDPYPLYSEDGALLQGTSFIYASRKERKYREDISWTPRGSEFVASSYLVVHPGDRTYPELAEEEGLAGGLPRSGAIHAS